MVSLAGGGGWYASCPLGLERAAAAACFQGYRARGLDLDEVPPFDDIDGKFHTSDRALSSEDHAMLLASMPIYDAGVLTDADALEVRVTLRWTPLKPWPGSKIGGGDSARMNWNMSYCCGTPPCEVIDGEVGPPLSCRKVMPLSCNADADECDVHMAEYTYSGCDCLVGGDSDLDLQLVALNGSGWAGAFSVGFEEGEFASDSNAYFRGYFPGTGSGQWQAATSSKRAPHLVGKNCGSRDWPVDAGQYCRMETAQFWPSETKPVRESHLVWAWPAGDGNGTLTVSRAFGTPRSHPIPRLPLSSALTLALVGDKAAGAGGAPDPCQRPQAARARPRVPPLTLRLSRTRPTGSLLGLRQLASGRAKARTPSRFRPNRRV